MFVLKFGESTFVTFKGKVHVVVVPVLERHGGLPLVKVIVQLFGSLYT